MSSQRSLMWTGIIAGVMAVAALLLFFNPIGQIVVGGLTGVVAAILLPSTNLGIVAIIVPTILWLTTAVILFATIWRHLKRR